MEYLKDAAGNTLLEDGELGIRWRVNCGQSKDVQLVSNIEQEEHHKYSVTVTTD